MSSAVLPELREYERTITAVANSYVHPQVSRYIASLAGKLDDGGVSAGLYILRSDGGLASAANAADSPVSMLLSGPAGGVAGAAWAAEQAGYRDFLTFDMGGTSTDVALVQDLLPRIGRETTVGDATTMVRDEAARTYIRRFGVIGDAELLGLLHELAETAAATVEAQGVPRSEQATTYHVDLRYHGQGFEITVPTDAAAFDGNGGRAGHAGRRVRRRAPAALLVPARGQRARAGQRARHRHRPAPRRRHGPAA